ncbi:MAG: nitrilase-related carbon-nitrogen hydrolase, partial [Thermoguttaceae bacterium]
MANPPVGPRSADETPSGSMRVAMAQISPFLGDRQQNLQLHLQRIDEARQQGADLIVFPELSLTGYCLRDMVPDVALDLHIFWILVPFFAVEMLIWRTQIAKWIQDRP